MNWNIDLDKKTATSINGITFKLAEVEPDVFHWECVNPKDIPPPEDAEGENTLYPLAAAGLARFPHPPRHNQRTNNPRHWSRRRAGFRSVMFFLFYLVALKKTLGSFRREDIFR